MEEKTYQTRLGTIHYWVSPGEGKPLVFLPGLTADHRLFEKQLAAFEGKYLLLVWDAPGHGASRPFRLDFSLDSKAVWLRAILRQEGIEKPILIGQSMGGYVAQCFLERFPGTAAGFLSIDSAPLKRKYLTTAELWMLKHTDLIYRPYPWKALQKAGLGVSATDYGWELMARMMADYTQKEYVDLAVHGFRILARAIEKDLPYTIDCPCLLLCGEEDKAGSAKRYNRRWGSEENLPLVWLPGAGHNSNCDAPERVNALIEDFIRRRLPAGEEKENLP